MDMTRVFSYVRPVLRGSLGFSPSLAAGGSSLNHSWWLRWEPTIRWQRGELMNKDPAIEAFYTSRAWRKCRASFLVEKSGLCEVCLDKGLITPATEVHHKVRITPENLNDPRVTLSHDNLMALCDECHAEQHRTKRWRCDELGHISL